MYVEEDAEYTKAPGYLHRPIVKLGWTKIVPGTPVKAGDGAVVTASTAGTVRLVSASGDFLDVYLPGPITYELEGYAIAGVNPAGTTATATVSVYYLG